MKHLVSLNKYFWKYKKLFIAGVICIFISNYFRILSPQITGYIVDIVQQKISTIQHSSAIAVKHYSYNSIVLLLDNWFQSNQYSLSAIVIICSVSLLILALLGGLFMFLMRQTIIVMSRHIEYAQKNEVFKKYLSLDTDFFKANATGDLMNRISEDVSRVRMYTGPAVMYIINLAFTIGFSIYFMLKANAELTLYVLSPLPLLALIIYFVNTIINKKTEKIQSLLSSLTASAQESYSGIRVIKSFVQENAIIQFFSKKSNEYKQNAIGLAKVEAIYFPAIALIIGVSTLLTIAIGSWYVLNKNNSITAGTITEFVIYINMLTFPVSAIGWTASIIQRAAASQKRLNDFLDISPTIQNNINHINTKITGDIVFNNVSFTYQNTGINALKNINLTIKKGQKILIMGNTGSGKSTLVQLLFQFYKPNTGSISIGNENMNNLNMQKLREQIGYIPQDVFLFSDSIKNNINFGLHYAATTNAIHNAATLAEVHKDIIQFENGYETVIGERGVTLSGGQKQRISIARALLKKSEILVLDDCLSAVDAKTANAIITNFKSHLSANTVILISHRILTGFKFDQIIILENGFILESGTHETLMKANGYYANIYNKQLKEQELE